MHERDLTMEFPGPQRVVDVIERACALFGEREMIVTPTTRLTYAEADRASRALAKRMIAAGVGKGTRIAVHLPNSAEWLVVFLAATRVGALFMPFSAAYKPAELRNALRLGDVQFLIGSTQSWHGGTYSAFVEEAVPALAQAETTSLRCAAVPFLREVWLFGEGDMPSWARPIAIADDMSVADVSDELLDAIEDQITPSDDAMIIWTSGTTADPKGAIHTQGTLARRAKANAHSHAFVLGDRVFCDFAFWWVGGPGYGFLAAFWVGATTLAVSKRDGGSAERFLAEQRPTRTAGWPSQLTSQVLVSEGSSHMISPRGIGMTETFGPHSMYEPEPRTHVLANPKAGLGPAILGFERKIIDPETGKDVPDGEEGELLVRGPGMMRGLYRRERDEVFDPDGWYHTGDKCVITDGIIHFISRFTDMIKTAGSNVAPLEVESVLYAMREVREPVVFGIPDRQRGEQVVAAVVRVADADIDEATVRERLRNQLSNYKVPRRVLILDAGEMPRLHSGKPDKRALREIMVDRLQTTETTSARS